MNDVAHRLRLAREAAGFATAADAAARFGWNYSTYAGHENGQRGVRLDRIERYARAFRVAPAWLATGAGPNAPAETAPSRPAAPGFSEPAIAPYRPSSNAMAHSLETITAVMAPGWRHLTLWQSVQDWTTYSVARGDVIVSGQPPRELDGDVVIVNFADPESRTVLAQRVGTGFILPPGLPRPAGEGAILGTVATVVRAPLSR